MKRIKWEDLKERDCFILSLEAFKITKAFYIMEKDLDIFDVAADLTIREIAVVNTLYDRPDTLTYPFNTPVFILEQKDIWSWASMNEK